MKTILAIVLFGTLQLHGQIKFDITDILIHSKQIADANFDRDAMGYSYSKRPWHVYDNFFHDRTIEGLLVRHGFEKTTTLKSSGFEFKRDSLLSGDSITTRYIRKAQEDFNFVEIQSPYFSKQKNVYSTILWIRDKSWTSGFCILVYFKMIKDKCVFVKGEPMVVSDLQEVPK